MLYLTHTWLLGGDQREVRQGLFFSPRRGSFPKTAELRICSLTSSNEHSGNISVPMKTTEVDESQIALFVLFQILERAVKYTWP